MTKMPLFHQLTSSSSFFTSPLLLLPFSPSIINKIQNYKSFFFFLFPLTKLRVVINIKFFKSNNNHIFRIKKKKQKE
ncbi:uncharacterized protein DS421_15g507500 [Arachis hypogaea]|nr:uncharacterized protein DS421_15g507500 [Arachis hypogaea]